MANYTRTELLNEVSKIFRAGLNPSKSGGVLDTSTEYQQLLELASITLLLNPDAVFYIARLAANRLNATVTREVAILEDILVALDDLDQIGKPVRDTAALSNARTAALSLDSARSVTNRPEAQRFTHQLDKFAAQLRKNLLSPSKGGAFARPREEARNIIQNDLTALATLHAKLLDQVEALRDLLDDFLSQDLPSKVSSSVLSAVSSRLQSAIKDIEEDSDPKNLASSRKRFLATLANKIGVKALTSFRDPTELKYRSPVRPIPSNLKHLGRVTGQGTPASVKTSVGPWSLPISAPLILSVSGGASVTIDLSGNGGAVLNSRNEEPYDFSGFSSDRELAVVVDPESSEGTVGPLPTITEASISALKELSFKHLGTAVVFGDLSPADGYDPEDVYPRYITDLRRLQSAIAADVSFSGSTLTVSSTSAGDEAAVGFLAGHVGGYVLDSAGDRFEILQVLSSTQCVLDTRGVAPDFTSGLELRGPWGSGSGDPRITFAPALSAAPTGRVILSPAVKTVQISAGIHSAADVISDIEAELGTYPAGQDGAKLNWHVKAEAVVGDPTKVALRARSRRDPHIKISSRYIQLQNPAGLPTLQQARAYKVLGLLEGETDTEDQLTPGELAAVVGSKAGLVAEAVDVDPGLGTQQVKISVSDAGPDTSLEVVSGPTELGLSAGVTYSSLTSFEAVDKLGNKLRFDRVVPGDLLRVPGRQEISISQVNETELILESGLPSDTAQTAFEIRSLSAREYEDLHTRLSTFTSSSNLLRKNKYNEDVQAVSNACSRAILPGQNFHASRNQAKHVVADLIAILTAAPLRESEYTASIPTAADNLKDILAAYSAPKVGEMDNLIEAFLDRKYERAVEFLKSGKFSEFYGTDDESGSFSGAVTSAARKVVRDLPAPSRTRHDFLNDGAYAQAVRDSADMDEDFSDIDEPEDYGL